MQKQNLLSSVLRFSPLKKEKNAKHLLIGLTIHRLTESSS